MNIYESAENYLERILMLKEENGNVKSIDIANAMNFTKASVSRAMKNLKENGYITVMENGNIYLTDKGLEIAKKIYERHQVISNFLINLGVKKEIALEDACKLEHDLSDESFNAIKNLSQYIKK